MDFSPNDCLRKQVSPGNPDSYSNGLYWITRCTRDPDRETASANRKPNPARPDCSFLRFSFESSSKLGFLLKRKNPRKSARVFCLMWALLDSNQRPPACKAGALNQLS